MKSLLALMLVAFVSSLAVTKAPAADGPPPDVDPGVYLSEYPLGEDIYEMTGRIGVPNEVVYFDDGLNEWIYDVGSGSNQSRWRIYVDAKGIIHDVRYEGPGLADGLTARRVQGLD